MFMIPSVTSPLNDQQVGPPSAPSGIFARLLIFCVGAMCLLGLMMVFLLQKPDFYRERVSEKSGFTDEQSRRFLTKVAGLRSAVERTGTWEAVILDDEANAWLAIDLENNHRLLLPKGLSRPRVKFEKRHIALGCTVGAGPFSSVVSMNVRVELIQVDQMRIQVESARIGAFPMPRGAASKWIEESLTKVGMVCEARNMDGTIVLFVRLPSGRTGKDLVIHVESLHIDTGEILFEGNTT